MSQCLSSLIPLQIRISLSTDEGLLESYAGLDLLP